VRLARVLGQVVSTVKERALDGHTLLLLTDVGPSGGGDGVQDPAHDPADSSYVAVDLVGAGVGEVVLVCGGGAARVAAGAEVPVDRAVVAIADSVIRAGTVTYSKS
jgi:ethanolamine utilization protein EutN